MLAQRRSASTPRLARDGYALLPAFLGSRDVAQLRPALDAAVAAPAAGSCERPHNTLVALRFDHPMVDLVLADDARVQAVAGATGAADLRFISAYVSVKEPRSPALWWHQDWWCWDHPVSFRLAAPQVALLIYVSDTDADTAALRVLPHSHRASTPLHAALPQAHADEAAALGSDNPAMRDQPGQRTLALSAGDAVVIDYRLLHATHANRTPRRRDCLMLTFAPDWSELPAEVRGHLIRHPALPGDDERPAQPWAPTLLPAYDGPRRDLALNRQAPARFQVAG